MSEKKKVKAFTIDARNWIRGEKFTSSESSCLLNAHGKMCCLGFFGEVCGVERETLRSSVTPDDTNDDAFPNWDYEPFITVNDNEKISDETRVQKLRALFKKRGVTVRFKNLPKGDSFTKPYRAR